MAAIGSQYHCGCWAPHSGGANSGVVFGLAATVVVAVAAVAVVVVPGAGPAVVVAVGGVAAADAVGPGSLGSDRTKNRSATAPSRPGPD